VNNLTAFVTHVHALKSASASIGAAEMAAQSADLEAIGKTGDAAFLRGNLPSFIQQFTELINEINAVLKTNKDEIQPVQTADDLAAQISLLHDLKSA